VSEVVSSLGAGPNDLERLGSGRLATKTGYNPVEAGRQCQVSTGNHDGWHGSLKPVVGCKMLNIGDPARLRGLRECISSYVRARYFGDALGRHDAGGCT